MILNLVASALLQESKPGSLYYRHPEYVVRWWWREFNRISYLGGREYARPTRLTVEFDYPLAQIRNSDGTLPLDSAGRPLDPSIATMAYGSMLFRHSREKSWEYENRRRRAHYHNIVGTTINMLVSHALKQGVKRAGDEQLTEFWSAVDVHRKQGIDTFIRDGLRMAEVEGLMWCVADIENKPTTTPNGGAPIGGDGKPYVYWVNPLDVLDWSVDQDGKLLWLKQFVYHERTRTPLEAIKPAHSFRVWYPDHVDEYECNPETGSTLAERPTTREHGFNRVPWEPLYAKKNNESAFPDGEPLASDLAKSANAIYNYTSLLDEILYKQTFSWLTIPDKNVDAVQIGTNTVFGYSSLAGGEPKYVSPDPEQARVLIEAITGELERARAVFGTGRGRSEGSKQQASGDALELESEDKRSILADVAASASDFENRLVGLLTQDMRATPGDTSGTMVQYPTSFDTRAFKDEVNEALSLQSVGMSPEIMLAIRQQLAARKLAGLPEDEKKRLLATLQAAAPVQTPGGPIGPGGKGALPGDPKDPKERLKALAMRVVKGGVSDAA